MYRLLIVDDEFEIRNGLCRYFPWNEVGFTVAGQVESGNDALDFMRSHEVDLVLCDIIMPGMTGLELAERIRTEFPCVRICLLTAYKDFAFAQRAISLNVLQYILKSASSAELLNTFRDIRKKMDAEATSRQADSHHGAPPIPSSVSAAPVPVTRDAKLISEIRQYVRDNYMTADLNSVAEAINMSPNYVSKLFKQKTNQNFSDYLSAVKMRHAAELLDNPHYRIYEISEMLGYKYVKNFSRAFRDYYGISPREYRNGKIPLNGQTIDEL